MRHLVGLSLDHPRGWKHASRNLSRKDRVFLWVLIGKPIVRAKPPILTQPVMIFSQNGFQAKKSR